MRLCGSVDISIKNMLIHRCKYLRIETFIPCSRISGLTSGVSENQKEIGAKEDGNEVYKRKGKHHAIISEYLRKLEAGEVKIGYGKDFCGPKKSPKCIKRGNRD